MKRRIGVLVPVVALAATLAACGSSGPARSTGTTTTAPASTTTAPASTSTTVPTAVLTTALDQAATLEGTSLATYQAVIAQIGAVAPFVNVVRSEQQHLSAVQVVAGHYGVTVPTSGFSAPAVPSTLTAACRLGVATEQHVIATYDRLMPQVAGYPDVAKVFTTLRSAAQDGHLPAFARCA